MDIAGYLDSVEKVLRGIRNHDEPVRQKHKWFYDDRVSEEDKKLADKLCKLGYVRRDSRFNYSLTDEGEKFYNVLHNSRYEDKDRLGTLVR